MYFIALHIDLWLVHNAVYLFISIGCSNTFNIEIL